MNFVNFFLYNKSTEHLTTLFLFILLIFFLLVLLWLLYKRKNFSLYTVWRLIDLFIHLIIALLIFRVISLPFALIIWFIWYISNGLLEDNKRKLRYINYVANNNIEYTKAYNYIHCSNDNKGFFESLKENVFISKNKNLNKWVIDKKKIAWKKTFLPFGYFIIGLIYPSINLLINGSQFSSLAPLPLRLLEINILIFTALWLLYPITNFLAVKIETGIMFQSKIWFNIAFILFALAIIFVLNGVLILS